MPTPKTKSAPQPEPHPEIQAATAAHDDPLFISQQRLRPVMGTLCAIEAYGPAESTHAGIAAAFAAMAHVDQCMHPTRSTSDLARLNGSIHTNVKLDAATWQVLAEEQRLCGLSNGVFDPCLPSRPGRISDLELLPDSHAICHVPLAIDLGGIAKGYAVDQAIAALRSAGCVSGLVNAGGDVRVFGAPARQILIRTQSHQTMSVTLRDNALAVSEMGASNHPAEHQGYYVRNADCVPVHTHVAVLADQAMIADALTKCLMFCDEATLDTLFAVLNARRVLTESAG